LIRTLLVPTAQTMKMKKRDAAFWPFFAGLGVLLAIAFLQNFLSPAKAVPRKDSTAQATYSQHTNRLIHERSPYLLQHAHNPVDWYPWGEEAFAKARKETSRSSCPWATQPVTGAT
jgi:Protein of unknown function, DUF255